MVIKVDSVRLLLNDDKTDHGEVLANLLETSSQFECMVAFAKMSALRVIEGALKAGLSRGLQARIAIGLHFHLTEPNLLRMLLALGEKYSLELFLSNASHTFHPKIYAFEHKAGYTAFVGSSNLTAGGLEGNFEASAVVHEASGQLMRSIVQYFDELIENKSLVSATKPLIDKYEREYRVQDVYRKLAKSNASRSKDSAIAVLRDILEAMKRDNSQHGFRAHQRRRKKNLKMAKRELHGLSAIVGTRSREFSQKFENLLGTFHSGGLHRGKGNVAQSAKQFIAAISSTSDMSLLSPHEAYGLLWEHFIGIKGAGVNLLTEILHTLDNKRFAVMNQNAVAGMALANRDKFPTRPTKQNVDANCYAVFCEQADSVRAALGLANFSELDALFNYAYWGGAESHGEE